MATRGTKHEHDFKSMSYSLQPRVSATVIRLCIVRPCIATEAICVLCDEDGNRRRHKGHTKKLLEGDRTTLNRAILGLTKAVIERERVFGKPTESDRRPCGWHPKEQWFHGMSGNLLCSICQGITKEDYERTYGAGRIPPRVRA